MDERQRRRMRLLLLRFVEAMTAWAFSKRTIPSYAQHVAVFLDWLEQETDVGDLGEVTPEVLSSYQTALLGMERKRPGKRRAAEPKSATAASAAAPEEEPLYGPTYLPRKFKIALAHPDDNTPDVLANDLGFIRHEDGWIVTIGGGMGMTHNKPATFPRLADAVALIGPDEVLEVAEEGNRYVVSVRFTGETREGDSAATETFDEIWHLSKPRQGSGGWLLAGIQQMQ